jgi:hypothetical protein
MAFLKGADPHRYSLLWMDLANQQNRGNDQYPKDLTAAYSMLVNYLGPNQSRQQNVSGSQAGGVSPTETAETSSVPASIGPHTFAQSRNSLTTNTTATATVPGSDSVTHGAITCLNCNANGHYANACPSSVSLISTPIPLHRPNRMCQTGMRVFQENGCYWTVSPASPYLITHV